ncbi:MAG: methyltransferase domain-containing protein [bacterium]|nr:methyltransferase domain-containing protein [bacterium]
MSNDWWKNFFDENYLDFWDSQGAFDQTKAEVRFLEKSIPLKKGQLILDLCCGHGRHSLQISRRGYKVIGLDYSGYELGLAGKEAQRLGLKVDFRQGDARYFKFREKFDLIINMFTAFGYGSKDDDRRIIRNAAAHLKKDGKFFIDYLNFPWLIRNYKAKDRKRFGKKVALIERKYDFLTDVNTEQRIIIAKGKKKIYKLHLRLYTLAQMAELFESEGLKVVKYWGKLGEPYSFDTKRMLILATKK